MNHRDLIPSKSRLNLAGENIKKGQSNIEDAVVIDTWRASHRAVLNSFQALLRKRTKGKKITVAQRHKRKKTIIDKLERFPKMLLARMDDVAGCRLIFKDIQSLYDFRNELHNAKKIKHQRRNDTDKYDYIKNPKGTGYRGIHDVYSYNVNSKAGKDLQGLLIELQYRTLIQHSWATTVEIIGFITENQPKFQRGDKRFEEIMIYASEILSRAHENKKGPLPEIGNKDLVEKFYKIDSEINLLNLLESLNVQKDRNIKEHKNMILIFMPDGTLDIRTYKDSTDALKSLFKLEKEIPHQDIVLVKGDTSDEVKLAFKNYFSDANDFLRLMQSGCEKLSGHRIIIKNK